MLKHFEVSVAGTFLLSSFPLYSGPNILFLQLVGIFSPFIMSLPIFFKMPSALHCWFASIGTLLSPDALPIFILDIAFFTFVTVIFSQALCLALIPVYYLASFLCSVAFDNISSLSSTYLPTASLTVLLKSSHVLTSNNILYTHCFCFCHMIVFYPFFCFQSCYLLYLNFCFFMH